MGSLFEVTLWELTVARFRWAWVCVMTTSSLNAILSLLVLDYNSFIGLLTTAMTVLLVLAVSASSVRAWVRK